MYHSQNRGVSSNAMATHQSTNSELCNPMSEMRPQQRFEMKPERPETCVNSVEYIVGEDDQNIDIDSDCEKADDSTSSECDHEYVTYCKPTKLHLGDPELNDGSSSTDCSSDASDSPKSKKRILTSPYGNTSICAVCGRGPFRSMKLHLLHCSGVRVKYQCSLCKKLFITEKELNEHYMPLYSCHICGQVFSHENLYHHHQCPKGSKSPMFFFCSETMPKVCNICKSFFTCEKTLLNHVTRVHTSVVSTKVCIITNPSALTDENVLPCLRGTAAQAGISSPNVVSRVINGKLPVDQTYVRALSTVVTSAPVFDPHGATDSSQAPVASEPVSPPMPAIIAMFENDSRDVALMKRMNTGWRFKAPYPCRQCGAIFRQPSLIISHRYLHRGRRLHQCQCGRAFKHRLHLLRHCVQHAEAISYICVSCGETFIGARLLAEHMKGKSQKKSRPDCTWKHKVKTECTMPFTCDCGQLFFRPSAYIWHQLKNWRKTKQMNYSFT
ncbi:zinc finger protein 883 [Channa argus]|uniref:zinc finger protein 883 n=1 Tax=Channa argus TaxID=215402 RepID=UPI00352066BC